MGESVQLKVGMTIRDSWRTDRVLGSAGPQIHNITGRRLNRVIQMCGFNCSIPFGQNELADDAEPGSDYSAVEAPGSAMALPPVWRVPWSNSNREKDDVADLRIALVFVG